MTARHFGRKILQYRKTVRANLSCLVTTEAFKTMVAKGGNLWKHPRLLASMVEILLENKPGTAKVGAISKAQNCKRGTLWALWNSSWFQKFKKNWRADPLETLRNIEKIEGETLWWNPQSSKKSRLVPKKIEWKTPNGDPIYRASGRRCFFWTRFWRFEYVLEVPS